MIPDRYLAKWAEKQADYIAEIAEKVVAENHGGTPMVFAVAAIRETLRRAWMREHMPELIDEGDEW